MLSAGSSKKYKWTVMGTGKIHYCTHWLWLLHPLIVIIAFLMHFELFSLLRRIWVQQDTGELVKAALVAGFIYPVMAK